MSKKIHHRGTERKGEFVVMAPRLLLRIIVNRIFCWVDSRFWSFVAEKEKMEAFVRALDRETKPTGSAKCGQRRTWVNVRVSSGLFLGVQLRVKAKQAMKIGEPGISDLLTLWESIMEETRDLSVPEKDATLSVGSGARAARARKKQEQILEGARRAFLQYGYARASTDLIAQSAGVSKQTLYAHYENKPQLLAAVLRHLLEDVSFPVSAPELGLHEALGQLAREIIRRIMQVEYLALLRVIIAEAPHHPEIAALFVETVPARGFAAIGEILRGAQREELLSDVDLEAAARLFIGSLLTYALLDGLFAIGTTPRLPSEERIEVVVDLVVRAIAKN